MIGSIGELENKCWIATSEILNLSGECKDGQTIDASHSFVKYRFDSSSSNDLERYYYVLRERILNDYVVRLFYKKFYHLQFEIVIYQMCENVKKIFADNCGNSFEENASKNLSPSNQLAKEELLDWIAALFAYYRKTENYNSLIKTQCYNCIILLVSLVFILVN